MKHGHGAIAELVRLLQNRKEREHGRDGVPAVPMEEGPEPGLGIADCPHCGEHHVHGVEDRALSHRVAHCQEKDVPGRGLGYMVMLPLPGIFRSLRWWEASGDVPANLGLSDPGEGAGDAGGLLAGVRQVLEQQGAPSAEGEL